MSKHTKGPWTVEYDHFTDAAEHVRAEIDGEMFDVASLLCDETGRANANARLIASAPELLEALRDILHEVTHDTAGLPRDELLDVVSAVRELAEAAIKKATGELQ